MNFETLLTELKDGIFTVTINRPDKLNALNKVVIEELGKAIDEIYENGEIKVAVITGAGPKAFVAGADISEFNELDASGGRALAQTGQGKGIFKNRKLSKASDSCGQRICIGWRV
jgi:enoyl-CoA hydratase